MGTIILVCPPGRAPHPAPIGWPHRFPTTGPVTILGFQEMYSSVYFFWLIKEIVCQEVLVATPPLGSRVRATSGIRLSWERRRAMELIGRPEFSQISRCWLLRSPLPAPDQSGSTLRRTKEFNDYYRGHRSRAPPPTDWPRATLPSPSYVSFLLSLSFLCRAHKSISTMPGLLWQFVAELS